MGRSLENREEWGAINRLRFNSVWFGWCKRERKTKWHLDMMNHTNAISLGREKKNLSSRNFCALCLLKMIVVTDEHTEKVPFSLLRYPRNLNNVTQVYILSRFRLTTSKKNPTNLNEENNKIWRQPLKNPLIQPSVRTNQLPKPPVCWVLTLVKVIRKQFYWPNILIFVWRWLFYLIMSYWAERSETLAGFRVMLLLLDR